MKKLITGILATLACCAFFTGCDKITSFFNKSEDSTPPESSIESVDETAVALEKLAKAAEFLEAKYNEEIPDEGRADYEVITSLVHPAVGGATYTVAWTVNDEAAANVKIEAIEGKTDAVLVNVNEGVEESVDYVLTATLSDAKGNKDTVSFNRTLINAPVPVAITEAPKANEAYKLYMYQVTKKGDCYFTGKMSGYYLASSSDAEQGVDVYAEPVENKENAYYLSFTDAASVKQYITVTNNYSNGKWRFNSGFQNSLTAAEGVNTTFEWNYNAQYNTLTATVVGAKEGSNESTTETSDVTCYMGTYANNWTFGASTMNYITGDDACIARLVKVFDKKSDIPAETRIATEAYETVKGIPSAFIGTTTYTLPTAGKTFDDVTIAWALADNTTTATLANNVLSFTAPTSEGVEIKLTATVSCGTATSVPVELTIAHQMELPEADSLLTIPEANEVGSKFDSNKYSENKYYVEGVISKNTSDSYGNFYITDAEGNEFYLYGLYTKETTDAQIKENSKTGRYDSMTVKPVVGDAVKVYGVIGQYTNKNTTTYQMKNARLYEHTAATATPSSVKAAYDEAAALIKDNKNGTIGKLVSVSDGKIVAIDSTSMTLADDAGNTLYVYGAENTVEGHTLAIGDSVTVVGVTNNRLNYNTSAYEYQLKWATVTDATASTLNDTQKMIIAKAALTTETDITENKSVVLPATGEQGATIEWSIPAGTTAAVIADGTITYTLQAEATTVELTATITIGELAPATVKFTVALSAAPKANETTIDFAVSTIGTTNNTNFTSQYNIPDSESKYGTTVSLLAEKNDSTTNPAYYAATDTASASLRLYKLSANGTNYAKLTISCGDGYVITKVILTSSTSKKFTTYDGVNSTCSEVLNNTVTLTASDDVQSVGFIHKGTDRLDIVNIKIYIEKVDA